jgi:hypothetical protein
LRGTACEQIFLQEERSYMNLTFDVDEEEVIQGASRLFDGIAPVSRFRGPATGGVWLQLVAAGWSDLGGALQRSELDLGVVTAIYREAGRHLVTEQLVTSGYLLAALVESAEEDDRDTLRSRLQVRPGVLLGDGRTSGLGFGADNYVFGTEEPYDLYRLSSQGEGISLGWAALPDLPVDADRVAGLSLGISHFETPDVAWLSCPLRLDAPGLAEIERTAGLLHSATMVGCAELALEVTAEFVKNRVQFNVPIGSFQSIKHGLADVLTASEVAWSAVLCAAASGSGDQQRVLVARLLSVQAALLAARATAQYHGGIGFTWELDVHFIMKRILDGSQRFGSSDDVAVELGRSVVEATIC